MEFYYQPQSGKYIGMEGYFCYTITPSWLGGSGFILESEYDKEDMFFNGVRFVGAYETIEKAKTMAVLLSMPGCFNKTFN